MNQWLGLGILLLGAGLGALLTRIADIALRRTNLSSAEGTATNLNRKDLSMMHLQPRGKVCGRQEQIRSNFEQILGGRQCP